MNLPQKSSKEIKVIDPDKSIEIINFSKRYKGNLNYSVNGASFIVRPGELHGFIGANGAGKTTTIKAIVGAYARFEGEIKIFGNKNETADAKSFIGYIPEKADFPKGYSTIQYLKTIAVLRGIKPQIAQDFAMQKLREMGIPEIARRSPLKLSSGQKRKVLLIQALLHSPKVIIADEPAANLDPKARADFFDTIKKLTREQGISFLVSSHILDELERYIDSLTILEAGKIVYTGSMKQLQEKRISENADSWTIKTSSPEKVVKVLNDAKISWNKVDNSIEFIANKKVMTKIFQALLNEESAFQSISVKGLALADIYKDFVKVGSMDLKGGDNA